MKSLLLALFVALLMVGCGEGAVDYDTLEDRIGVMYLPNEETPFTGRAESFHENGQKGLEVTYKDGELHGLLTRWYENGQKKEETNYKDGETNGLWTDWYENGQKEKEANFKDGKLDGLWTFWYENGQKKREGNIKDGKLISAEAWEPNGEKCPVTNVRDGKGVLVWYNEDGTVKSHTTYKDGEEVED